MEKVSSKEYAVGSMQTAYCLLFTFLYCLLPTSLYAQDFALASLAPSEQRMALELMKCRASLDRVIVDAGPKYHKIEAQADAISDAIEKLREELNTHNTCQNDIKWEVSFRRKIVCIDISIKALGAEIKKYLCMGTAI